MRNYSKSPVGLTLVLVIMAALIVTIIGGCSAARKPAPESTEPRSQSTPAPTAPAPGPTPTPVRNMPTNPAELNRISKGMATEVARIPGVNSATVVISGNTAYVGIDMKAGVEKRPTARIKNDVVRVVKNRDHRIARVLVSSDADTVTRIKRISDGISKGHPMSTFNREMAEIARRMSPTVR